MASKCGQTGMNDEEEGPRRSANSPSTSQLVYTWVVYILWLVVILLCVTACLYFCTGRIKNLIRKPMTTTITIDRQLEIDFPAVSICNLNVLRKDYLQRIGLDGFFKQSTFLNYLDSNETNSCTVQLKNTTDRDFTNLEAEDYCGVMPCLPPHSTDYELLYYYSHIHISLYVS